MKLLKEVLVRGFQGISIGISLIYTIAFIFILVSGKNQVIDSSFFIKQYVAGAVIGFFFGVLNLLFQVDRLGIIGATIIHFIGICIVFFKMGYYAGWIGYDAMSIIEALVVLIVSYFFIWLFCYIGWKKEVDKINRNLKNNDYNDKKIQKNKK